MTEPISYSENLPSPYTVRVYPTEQGAIYMANAINLIVGLQLCKPSPHAQGWVLNPVRPATSRK